MCRRWHGDLAADLNAILASRFSAFKISDIAKSDLGDLAQGLARQESLRLGYKRGIATECIGGGQGGAMLIEAV